MLIFAHSFEDKKGSRRNTKRRRNRFNLRPNERVMRTIIPNRKISKVYGKVVSGIARYNKRIVLERFDEVTVEAFSQSLEALYETMPWFDNVENIVQTATDATNKDHQEKFYKAANEAIGFNLSKFISEQGLEEVMQISIDESVAGYQDLEGESQRSIASKVNRALIERKEDLVDLRNEVRKILRLDISKSLDRVDSQATFIARDQTQRLFNTLNRERQVRVGIKRYVWITSKDERVRATHRAKDGKKYEWVDPPKDTGHPGHDYNCRCTAAAVLEL